MSENVTFSIKKESSFRRVSENTSTDELHSADEIPTTKQLKTASRNIHYYIHTRAQTSGALCRLMPRRNDAHVHDSALAGLRLRTRRPETAHSFFVSFAFKGKGHGATCRTRRNTWGKKIRVISSTDLTLSY